MKLLGISEDKLDNIKIRHLSKKSQKLIEGWADIHQDKFVWPRMAQFSYLVNMGAEELRKRGMPESVITEIGLHLWKLLMA